MREVQLSAYIPNRPGELARLTSHLARFDINIRAISISETADAGIVRMIVNDADRAAVSLSDLGCGFITTEVLTLEVPDRPGALSDLCKKLWDSGVNIRYLYATVTPGGGVAMAVLNTDDNDRAEQLIGG